MAVLPSAATVVVNPGFLLAAALVAVGTVGADSTTKALRANVAAVDFTGSDAAYGLVGAALTHTVGAVLGLKAYTKPIALGMVASASLSAKREFMG